MNLRHLVEAIRRAGGELEVGAELGALDLEILHVTDRASEAGPHSLLVIPRGTSAETHVTAAGLGAGALLVEKPVRADVPVVRVRNARRAMGLVLGALHQFPTERLISTAVTGRRGKTLTAFMLASMLSRAGVKTGLISSLMVNTGHAVSGINGAPDPSVSYDLLDEMTKSGLDSAIVELPPSSEAADCYAGLSFDLAVWAGSGPERPPEGLFPDLKPYGRVLFLSPALFPELAPLTSGKEPEGFDLPLPRIEVGGAASDIEAVRLTDGKWLLKARHNLTKLSGGLLDDHEVIVRQPAPGRAHTAATLLSAAAALLHGLPPDGISDALDRFPGVYRRFQTVYAGAFTVVDDHPSDPVALVQSLADLADLKANRLIPVAAVYGGLGQRFNSAMSAALARTLPALGVDRLILTDCRGDAPLWAMVTQDERAAFLTGCSGGELSVEYYSYLADALTRAISLARDGDVVAMLGGDTLQRGQAMLDGVLAAEPRVMDREPWDEMGRGPLLKPLF